MHAGFPTVRSVPDHDQLAIALALREKEKRAYRKAIASRETDTDRKPVVHSIKAGE